MNYQKLSTPHIKFSFKNEKFEFEECSLLKSSPNSSISSKSFDLNNDFNIISNNDCNNIDDEKVLEDEAFVKELRFFKVDESIDTITLSTKLLSDESWFKDKILYFSDGKAFSNNTK